MRRRQRAIGFYTKKTRRGKKKVVPILPSHGRISVAKDPSLFSKVAQRPLYRSNPSRQSAQRATVMEISRYLSGYLSGEENVRLLTSPRDLYASTERGEEKIIYLPDWQTYTIPVEGVDKWRIYRNGLWHETQHIKHTPQALYGFRGNDPLSKHVVNIIEDRRVEDLGSEYHRGYVPEVIYSHAYGLSIRSNPSELWDQSKKLEKTAQTPFDYEEVQRLRANAKQEALIQGLIVGKQKGTLPPKEQAKVDETIRHVESHLARLRKRNPNPKSPQGQKAIMTTLEKLTDDVIRDLDLRIPLQKHPPEGQGWGDTFSKEHSNKRQRQQNQTKTEQKGQVKKDMEKFFDGEKKKAEEAKRIKREDKPEQRKEKPNPRKPYAEDVEKARKTDQKIIEEFKKIQSGKPFQTPEGLSTDWQPIADIAPTVAYKDPKFVTDMRTRVREWRVGRRLRTAKSGQLVNIPAHIRTGGKKSFSKLERRSVKGQKYLFVLDFSGSMKVREKEYKKALIGTMETLEGIRSKTAVFAFGAVETSTGPRHGFFRVKTFEQGRWKKSDSGRIAALQARYNSTPLSSSYGALGTYVKKHRPDITVTITDGLPDDKNATRREVQKLRKHTKMVAFGIKPNWKKMGYDPKDPNQRQQVEELDKQFAEGLPSLGYSKHFIVDDVNKVPKKLVDMIAPKQR